MPELDDARSLVPLAASAITADDLVAVYHAASNSVRKVPASDLLSGTTESILEKLKGAENDPEKIGAEYMPDILPVDAVVVSDASSLVLPNGSIARDSNNRIFVHDNKTTGGVNISGLLLRGAASYNAATDDALLDAHVLDIAEVAIPPDMFTTAGGKLSIIGRLSVVSSLTSYTPAANTKIILYWADQSGAVASNHLGWTIATAAAPAAITNLDIAAYTPATVSGGFLTLSAEQGLTRMDTASASGGTITSSSIVSATSGTSASRRVAYAGDVSRVLRLALLLPADSATADAGGLIYVHSNILLQRLDA